MADDRIRQLAQSYRSYQDQQARSAAVEVADAAVRASVFAQHFDGLWNAVSEALRHNAIAFNDEAGEGSVFAAEVFPSATHVTRRDGAMLRLARVERDVTAVVESSTTTQVFPLTVELVTGQQLAFVFAIPGATTAPQSAADAAYALFKRLVEIH